MDRNQIIFWVVVIASVFLAHNYSGFLEDMVVAGNKLAWGWLFLWYLVWVGIIGTLAGKQLGVRF